MDEENGSEGERTTEEIVPPEPVTVPLERMGRLTDAGSKIVELSGQFLVEQMGAEWLDDIIYEYGVKSVKAIIRCPFCAQGHLTFLSINAIYRETAGAKTPRDQIGSKYLYRCSNPGCPARFWGNHLWEKNPWEKKT